jgi:hypothetical protein
MHFRMVDIDAVLAIARKVSVGRYGKLWALVQHEDRFVWISYWNGMWYFKVHGGWEVFDI